MSSPAGKGTGRKVTLRGLVAALVFVVSVQSLSMAITFVDAPVVAASGASYAPLGTSAAASAGNSVILVLAAFATTLGLLWIVRRRRLLSFRLLVFAATSVSLFVLTLLAVDAIFYQVLGLDIGPVPEILLAASPVAALAYGTIVRTSNRAASVVLAVLSAEVGSYFAATIPLLTALLIPVAFSAYDAYAVFRGPLGALVSAAPPNLLSGVSVRVDEFTIGLGDAVFYSMLPSLAIFRLDPFCAATTAAAVNAGMVVTLYLLTRKKMLPGLPIPMALGVASLLLCLR